MLGLLATIPPADQVDALSKLDSALRTQRADVRNVSAFLAGVVKRMAGGPLGGGGGGMGPPGRGPPGGMDARGPPPGGMAVPYGHAAPPSAAPQAAGEQQLAPAAAQVLDRLYAEGRLRRGDLDARSLASLAALQPEAQAFVMHTFADRNLTTVRNMSGQGALLLACQLLRCGFGSGPARPSHARSARCRAVQCAVSGDGGAAGPVHAHPLICLG